MESSSEKVVAVIMVGGPTKGTRFRPFSFNTPKPLFPLAGQPMVHHPISACKRCVLAELGRLGDAYSGSLSAARNLMPARCDHEKRKSAVHCITDIIGENNGDHFFVTTQNAELRKKLQEIPGVPLIYGLRNSLLLEPLSKSQHQLLNWDCLVFI